MPAKLPPGLSPETFALAISEFQSALGDEWVFVSDDDLETYRDAYSIRWGHEDEYFASAAVAPANVEQVQAIVRIADRHTLPLYPISTGKNLTYGGPAPSYTGSVVVDLKRMNRVLEVNEERHYALVEPGCSYFDLYRFVKDRGLKVWIDCPDPGWGSLIGNALDHGVGYTGTPFRDHWGAHCGLEAVLPNGEVIRTGMGAAPNAQTWQDYRYGVGPDVDGLFAQGNFGIVTKMGFWLMPQPDAWLTGTVSVPKYSDLEHLIRQVNYLQDSGIINGEVSYRTPFGGFGPSELTRPLTELMSSGWPSVAQLDSMVEKAGRAAWTATLQFYGPEECIQAAWSYTRKRITQSITAASFDRVEMLTIPLTPEQEQTHHLVSFGIPNMQTFAMMSRAPNDENPPDGHADLVCVVPRSAERLYAAQRVLYETQKELGLSATATPFSNALFCWHHKVFHLFTTPFWTYRDDPEKNRIARAHYEIFVRRMSAAGFPPYRTNISTQDLVAQQFSFGNNSLLRFQEALKDGADPNGIIAPGRYGVWPRRLRGNRA